MKTIDAGNVRSFFESLNQSSIRYLLLKNVGDILPDKLPIRKDIDILVHPDDRDIFLRFMKREGFINNPYCGVKRKNGFTFLYPMDDGDWFVREKMIVEVFYQINVRALKEKCILPLDYKIQKSIWENRHYNSGKNWYELGGEDMLIYLVVRCIFDKKEFSSTYISEIEKRKDLLERSSVHDKFSLIVFGFADRLICMLKKKEYSKIISEYISYSDY